jgi:hypothetical protein
MGEVAAIAEPDGTPLVEGAAYLLRPGQGEEERVALNIGDTVLKGDVVVTGEDTVLELLLGINGRLRLSPGSRLRMEEITPKATAEGIITYRRVELLAGEVRSRVRQNTVTPAPVLLITVGSRLTVGHPELATRGGVDAVVRHDPEAREAVATVLNGAVRIQRQDPVSREQVELALGPGYRLQLPPPEERLAHPRPLGSPLLETEDIIDWPRFLSYLQRAGTEERSTPARAIWSALPAELRRTVRRVLQTDTEELPDLRQAATEVRQRVLDVINQQFLREGELYARPLWTDAKLSDEARQRLAAVEDRDLKAEDLVLLNRLLLESTLPEHVERLADQPQRRLLALQSLRDRYAFSTEWRRAEAPPPPRESSLGGP